MLQRLKNIAIRLNPAVGRRQVKLTRSRVQEVLESCGAESWFLYAFDNRHRRWDIWKVTDWIRTNVAPESAILETGCGCALNLIWLAQQRFHQLAGFDLAPTAVAAARRLGQLAGANIDVWVDDGLKPANLTGRTFEVIIALNWTFLLEPFSLTEFFNVYRHCLTDSGRIIIDVIDTSYEKVPNNQYLTSDWSLPEASRRSTEYKHRFTRNEVEQAGLQAGLRIIDIIAEPQLIPKCVYILSPLRSSNAPYRRNGG